MIKLNKQQINALANKFYNEKKNDIDKLNKEALNKSIVEYKPLFEKAQKVLKQNDFLRSVEVKLNNGYDTAITSSTTFKTFSEKWDVINSFKPKTIKLSLNNIENDIILATIDSISVDEIINSLKTKYK